MQIEVSSTQGNRKHMEDALYVNDTFGGVYDGHGGAKAALYTAENLHKRFYPLLEQSSPEQAFIKSYEEISSEIGAEDGGTCAANFYITGGQVYFANAGDCRIIIVGKKVKQLTIDHNLKNEDEVKRVQLAGGMIRGQYVFVGYSGLAVSRSLGDQLHKQSGVISIPFVGSHKILSGDKFLICASDGLFKKLSNEEVSKLAIKHGSKNIAETLKNEALKAGSKDNISVIVVRF